MLTVLSHMYPAGGTSIAAIAYLHIIYLIYLVYLIYLDTPFKLMEILPSRLGTHVS